MLRTVTNIFVAQTRIQQPQQYPHFSYNISIANFAEYEALAKPAFLDISRDRDDIDVGSPRPPGQLQLHEQSPGSFQRIALIIPIYRPRRQCDSSFTPSSPDRFN